jgi:uncharacterized protein YunC (DUF1805 family)
MLEIDTFERNGKTFQYIKLSMEKAPLLLIKGPMGFAMCGYLNIEAAEKLGDLAVRVTGVNDLNSMLGSKISQVTSKARQAGISEGQTVADVLKYL